jgi:hypothetical protein
MLVKQEEIRWVFTIPAHGPVGSALSVNSIDGDPAHAKVTLERVQVIVPIADLVQLLEAVAGHARSPGDHHSDAVQTTQARTDRERIHRLANAAADR